MRKVLKPAEGRLVRDPVTKQPLPPEGKEVEMSSYWTRRVASGEVVEVQPEKKKSKSEETK